MCGIVGYIGPSLPVEEVIVDGLRRLEYRGYDSAGVAVWDGNELCIRRAVGKLSNLDAQLRGESLAGGVGLGHTRWATHGKPEERNAHPHRAGEIAIVHNGILENYRELRAELEAAGRVIRSDADRGVVLLIDQRFSQSRYRQLFPPAWNGGQRTRSVERISQAVETFWQEK